MCPYNVSVPLTEELCTSYVAVRSMYIERTEYLLGCDDGMNWLNILTYDYVLGNAFTNIFSGMLHFIVERALNSFTLHASGKLS